MESTNLRTINKSALRVIVGVFLIILSVCQISFSQAPTVEKPLSFEQVEALIKNKNEVVGAVLQDAAISLEIEKRGVYFDVTEAVLGQLKILGAGPKTILALTKIKDRKDSTRSPKRSNRITILVARFAQPNDARDNVSGLVIGQIQEALAQYQNVEVLELADHISANDGKKVAVRIGKERRADIVIWGWYNKSTTDVVINANIEIILDIPNDVFVNRDITIVEQVINFENFSAQLRLSKRFSFLTVVSLGLLSYELENYAEAVEFASDSIAGAQTFPKLVNLSELYLLRAEARLNAACNYLASNVETTQDVKMAERLGVDPNNIRVLRILALANLANNNQRALEYVERYRKTAVKNEDIILSLYLITSLYLEKGDQTRSKENAGKIKTQLLTMQEGFENNLYLGFAYFILDDFVRATLFLDKAQSSAVGNRFQLSRVFALQGILYLSTDSFDLAIGSIKRSLELRPSCMGFYFLLAAAYREKGDVESEIATYNEALELEPNLPILFVNRGEAYEAKDDLDRALANYQKAVELDPNSIEAYRRLGAFYTKTNKPVDAISAYSKFLNLNDEDEDVLENRAKLFLDNGQYESALADYRRWISLRASKPDDLSRLLIQSTLAALYVEFVKRNDNKNGIEFSNKHIQLFPKDTVAYLRKAYFLESSGQIDPAIETIGGAIRLARDEPSLFEGRSRLWKEKGNLERALSDINQAINLDKKKKELIVERARLYMANDKFNLAIADYRSVFEVAPENAKLVLLELNIELRNRSEYVLGVEFSSKYLKLFPGDDWGYHNQAFFLEANRDLDSAVASETRAIELRPDFADYYVNRSRLWKKKENIENALRDINQAIILNPNASDFYYERSGVYEKSGNVDLAIEDLEKAIKLTKNPLYRNLYESNLAVLRLKKSPKE